MNDALAAIAMDSWLFFRAGDQPYLTDENIFIVPLAVRLRTRRAATETIFIFRINHFSQLHIHINVSINSVIFSIHFTGFLQQQINFPWNLIQKLFKFILVGASLRIKYEEFVALTNYICIFVRKISTVRFGIIVF